MKDFYKDLADFSKTARRYRVTYADGGKAGHFQTLALPSEIQAQAERTLSAFCPSATITSIERI